MKRCMQWLIKGPWLFPILIILMLLILTFLRINGSSIGHFHNLLFGDTTPDSSLIAGQPRTIRSDEWGVNTPMVVSQANQGYPSFNKTTGDGQDVSITFDVPYKDWSTIFKPQNWSFFVMPLEFAFAFKWWLPLAALILACYALSLKILHGKRVLSILVALAFAFSPFVHWWYQAPTVMPIVYALLITTIVLYIGTWVKTKRLKIAALSILTYLITSFLFVGYIPFLAPLALVTAAFTLGFALRQNSTGFGTPIPLKKFSLLAIPVVLSLLLFGLFLHGHSAVLTSLGESEYPGQRTVESGGYSTTQLLGGYFNIQLKNDALAMHAPTNQSEYSNFIILIPMLLLPLIYTMWLDRSNNKKIDLRVVGLLIVSVLLLIRLFVPASEPLFNVIQLNRIPHNRLTIGIGLLNLLFILITLEKLSNKALRIPYILQVSSVLLALLTVLGVGFSIRHSYPGYLPDNHLIWIIGIVMSLITYALVSKKLIASIALLVVFSFISIAGINPLYRGLGILQKSRLSTVLVELSKRPGKTVVGDYAAAFETLPSANGVKTLSGVYAYPQLKVWDDIAKDPASKAVYNRYAHVFFSVSSDEQTNTSYFDPPALDAFRVHSNACSQFLNGQDVRYVIQTVPLASSCATKIDEISYPKITFYVYQLSIK